MFVRFGCMLTAAVLTASAAFAGQPQTVTLDVPNMTCPLCPITVRKALEKVPGVKNAKVDLEKKAATVTFDPDRANAGALIKATTDAGYPSGVHK
jgi:mercuric ion binding protein